MDVIPFQTNKFLYVGRLMAMSLFRGEVASLSLLNPMYEYLCGVDPSSVNVSVNDVPNSDAALLLQKVIHALHTILVNCG